MGLNLNVSSGIGDIANDATSLIERFFPDKTKEEQAKLASVVAMVQGQLNANIAAAQKQTITFRDGAGWVCVFAFALSSLRAPIEWLATLAGHPITLPEIDTSTTGSMLTALLGLGTMHLYQSTRR